MKAIIYAAKDYPWVNATNEGDNMHIKKYFNIGMAVARNNSLIVPVIKNCEQKSILQIAKDMKELGDKPNADKLSMSEITGGTFTITNAGVYGALNSTPIIAHPQVAILGVHKIVEKPVVRNMRRSSTGTSGRATRRGSAIRRTSSVRSITRPYGASSGSSSSTGEPLCRTCLAAGLTTPAKDVDHLIRARTLGDTARFWDAANLQPLCHSCHSRKTAHEVGFVKEAR